MFIRVDHSLKPRSTEFLADHRPTFVLTWSPHVTSAENTRCHNAEMVNGRCSFDWISEVKRRKFLVRHGIRANTLLRTTALVGKYKDIR
jgi:hypothetical protein